MFKGKTEKDPKSWSSSATTEKKEEGGSLTDILWEARHDVEDGLHLVPGVRHLPQGVQHCPRHHLPKQDNSNPLARHYCR